MEEKTASPKTIKKSKPYIKIVIILIIFVILLISICLYYFLGYIPILGTIIAKSKLNNYTATKSSVYYEIYGGEYVSEYMYMGKPVIYDLKRNMIYDYSLISSEEQEVNQKYHEFLNENSILSGKNTIYPEDIGIWISIDANNLSNKYYKARILCIYDDFSGTEEGTKERITDFLYGFVEYMKPDYNFNAFQLVYANLDSAYELILDCKKNDIDFSEISDSITEYNGVLNTESYIEWKENIK